MNRLIKTCLNQLTIFFLRILTYINLLSTSSTRQLFLSNIYLAIDRTLQTGVFAINRTPPLLSTVHRAAEKRGINQ